MNFINNHNSEDTRNEEETRALQESGAQIARARFDSIPDASEFKGRLKAQLLQKREIKRTSMWQKIREALSHFIPTQKTFVVGFVVFLLVAVVSTALLNRPGLVPGTPTFAELLIDRAYAKDNFEIIPTSGDGLAVDGNTEFLIKSKTALNKDALSSHIHLSPDLGFDLTQVNEHEFRLTPKSELKEKQVYSVKIDAVYTDEQNLTVERDFSFAFQVKNEFKLLSIIPSNQSTGVPLNSGIELTFSSENYSDFERNFSIVPKVDGKFEVHGRTLVFVPKELQPSTIYTVTLKKDIVVKGTAPMKEDVVLHFETAPKTINQDQSYWYMNTTKAEFAPNGPMLFSIGGSDLSEEFTIRAFAFKSFDLYKKNFIKQQEIPAWAYETQRDFVVPETDMSLARSFTLKPQSLNRGDYSQYLVLPENLPVGDYWIEIENNTKNNGQKQHLFAEVTNLSTYLNVMVDKTLLWVNDLSTKGPVQNVQVSTIAGESLAKTDATGIATFDTKALHLKESSRLDDTISNLRKEGLKDGLSALQITNGNESTLLRISANPYAVDSAMPVTDKYIFNFSTDRSMYLPNDVIKFWGFIQKRDKSEIPKTFTVGIPNYNNYFYGRGLGDLDMIQSVEVMPDADGYFRGEIKLSNLTANGYSLVLKNGEEQISNRYLEVIQYVKPSYTLSAQADKKAIFLGESLNLKAKMNFFEGTPVPNYSLKYASYHDQQGDILKTDKNGEIAWTFTPKENVLACNFLTDSNCYASYERYKSLSVSNLSVEESPLMQYLGYTLYTSKVDGMLDFLPKDKTLAIVSSTWSNLNLAPLNNDDYGDDQKIFASPAANKQVEGTVFETHYEKREGGQYYNFITKTTEQNYYYERVTVVTANISGQTDANGHFNTEITTIPERSYEIRLRMKDDAGHDAFLVSYLYNSGSYDPNSNVDWYSLRDTLEKTDPVKLSYGYKVGEQVNLEMYKNDLPLQNTTGSILFTELQSGLKKYRVQANPLYSFTFGEDSIPNVYVSAVYFDGQKYQEIAEGTYRTNIMFDSREREIKVNLNTDKASYKPGDSITVSLETLDKSGKGHPAKVNISVIDEAYLALVFGNGNMHNYAAVNPLQSIYAPVVSGVFVTERSHKAADLGNFGGAEGGGCFLAGTPILMADGTTKNIENIMSGDLVSTLKNESDDTSVSGKVIKTQNHIVSEYRIINGTLRVTPEHRILVNGEWKTAGEIHVGDFLRGQKGQPVKVESIEIRHGLVKVYNFAVENYHTYIAGGIYVHNDKGGANTRSEFPDVALYQFVQTDSSGHGSVTFKVPDSVTGWRVTAEALSPDLHAGIGDKKVDVSLPVFGLFSVPSFLLTGDKPILSGAVYGNAVPKDTQVSLKFSGDLFGAAVSKTTLPFESVRVSADKSVEKSGKVRLDISTKLGKDAIEKSFYAENSHIVESAQTLLSLSNGPLDLGPAKSSASPVELKFVDAGMGSLYYRMADLSWNGGTRLDQKVGSIVARDWFRDFFAKEELSQPASLSLYVASGFKLLPYSSEDLSLTAKTVAVLKDTNSFDKDRIKMYFIGELYNVDASSQTLSEALWGAAALGEPVLPSIRTLAQNEKSVPQDKIYLALAATELGDNEYARTLYDGLLKNVKETDSTAKIIFAEEGKNQIIENSALMSVLGARLREPLAEKFDRFVQNEPKEIFVNLESLLFIKEKLAMLEKGNGSLTLTVADQKIPVNIEKGSSQSVKVAPVNFGALSITDLKGPIAAIAIYDTPAQTNNLSTEVKLTREYFVNGQKVNSVKEGDMVEVRLTPVFGKDAPAGQYLVEDSLPSGLKITSPLDNTISPWSYTTCPGAWPFEVGSGRVKFTVNRDFQARVEETLKSGYSDYGCIAKPYISYLTRVSTLGEFRKEGALIQSLESNDVKNFSTDLGTIIIGE